MPKNTHYVKAFNVYGADNATLASALPGQWVYAGDRTSMGRFYGVKASGSVVVAWLGNARRHERQRDYFRTIYNYAQGK